MQIFFVLSGFVIASNLDGLRRLTAAVIARSMLRRSIRLDPVYWVLIALNAGFLLTLSSTSKGDQLGTGVVLANMFYVNGILGQLFIVPVGWTLTFEMQLYLTLAVGLGLSRLLGARAGDLAGRVVVFVPLLVLSTWRGMGIEPVRATAWALAAWHMFFLGAATFWVASSTSGVRAFFAGGVAATTAVFAVIREPVTLLAPLTASVIGFAARRGSLTMPPGGASLQWLGKLSYSSYLIHPFVGNKLLRLATARSPHRLSLVEDQLLRWCVFAIATALPIGCAWILWRAAERPAQLWARRVSVGG